jgi:hypothetical protein
MEHIDKIANMRHPFSGAVGDGYELKKLEPPLG